MPEALTPHRQETPGELAERLIPVATDLVIRVHDEGRDSAGQLLSSLTDTDRWALLIVLAAMVPPDAPVGDLLAWVTWNEHGHPPGRPARTLRPCGTHAAFVRHKARGEPPCAACIHAERAYQRARPRRQRAA